MFCYMATTRAPRDDDGNWLHPVNAKTGKTEVVFNKRGLVEPPPVGDPSGFQRRMAKDGYEVRFHNEDLGDVIDINNKTVHKKVVRRPGKAWKWSSDPPGGNVNRSFDMDAVMVTARHPGILMSAPGLVHVGGGLLVDPDLIRKFGRALPSWFRERLRKLNDLGGGILDMAGFLPDEGETLIAKLVFQNADVDRGTNMDLNLFTNVAPGETITEATLTRPTGTGYAAISLVDATWGVTGDTADYAQQTFTGGAGGWTGSIQGYDITTKGTANRIVAIEVDGNGPYTINENDTYKITPNITVA